LTHQLPSKPLICDFTFKGLREMEVTTWLKTYHHPFKIKGGRRLCTWRILDNNTIYFCTLSLLALLNVLFPPGTILDCFLVQHRVGVIALREIIFIP
jgi:hypothetical protein